MSRQIGSKRQRYSVQALDHAADLVRSKSISLNMAAKQYCIPKTTLQNAVTHKYGTHKVGKNTVLTDLEETRVADWAIRMAKIGYGRTRQELATTVKKIIDDDGRPNPFKDNKPGRAWMDGFFHRHPDLSLRTTIQLGKERAIISPDRIARWFDAFQNYIENEVGDKDLLNDPTRIYNADETGVSLCMKGNQVVGIKGAPVHYHYGNSDKTQLTVMAACSASAHYLPPMIIFPGQRFSYNPLEGFEEAALGRSHNGWMDSEVFCNWLENVFVPGINDRHVKKPVLLLIDGHVTHVTLAASDICRKNGIEMYCLLEHASHVLQPLDLRFFSSLKRNWRQAVRDWQSEHIGEYVTKVTFARVLKNAWNLSTTVDVAVKGFKEAGLFPLDPKSVLQSIKIEPSQIFGSKSAKDLSATSPPPADKIEPTPVEPTPENGDDHILVSVPAETPTENGDEHLQVSEPAEPPKETHSSQLIQDLSTETQVSELIQDDSTDSNVTSDTRFLEKSETDTKQNAPASPFSKHLVIPMPKVQSKSKTVKRINTPWKAITGTNYRKMMEEKIAKKKEEEEAKEKRKQERIEKRKIKEDEKLKKMEEKEAKRQKRSEEKTKKREFREKLMRALESGSESEEEMFVDNAKCFTCETPYSTDYIECVNCFRRFHLDCVEDEYIHVADLPFECKYC